MNNKLSERLRAWCEKIRRTPVPISDVIPLLQEVADFIDAQSESATPAKAEAVLSEIRRHLLAGAFIHANEPRVLEPLDDGTFWGGLTISYTKTEPTLVEPVAHLWQHLETGRTRVVMPNQIITTDANWVVVGPLYLAATPPQAPTLTLRTILAVCPKCGNKRCPHATNKLFLCTNSNEPNQKPNVA